MLSKATNTRWGNWTSSDSTRRRKLGYRRHGLSPQANLITLTIPRSFWRKPMSLYLGGCNGPSMFVKRLTRGIRPWTSKYAFDNSRCGGAGREQIEYFQGDSQDESKSNYDHGSYDGDDARPGSHSRARCRQEPDPNW